MLRLPFFSFLILLAGLASCGKMDYKKTPGGLVYKIFRSGDGGDSVKEGNFVKFHIQNKVNDSIYRNTFGQGALYMQAASLGEKYDISEIWTSLRKGDSVIAVQSLDTFIKRGAQLPPEIKRGDILIVTMKILEVYKTEAEVEAAKKTDAAKRVIAETAELKKYFTDNKIEGLQQTPSGAFVKIIKQGSGKLIDTGNYVSVLYRGTSWSGVVFDSNMDTSFNQTPPLSVTIGKTSLITGFVEGLRMLRKGDDAKIYIPSALGYGPQGNPPNIKPNEHLIFDIMIVDIKDKEPPPPPPVRTLRQNADTAKGK